MRIFLIILASGGAFMLCGSIGALLVAILCCMMKSDSNSNFQSRQ